MTLHDNFQVGDKINLKGPTVPTDLLDKYWIVEAVTDDSVKLSRPYLDAACTEPYHPPDPRKKRR